MQEIIPSVEEYNVLCAEEAAGPNVLVVFGASGDLAHRKLLASLFELYCEGLLSEQFYVLGCGRKEFSDAGFRDAATQSIRENSDASTPQALDAFANKLYYLAGDYDDPAFYQRIKA